MFPSTASCGRPATVRGRHARSPVAAPRPIGRRSRSRAGGQPHVAPASTPRAVIPITMHDRERPAGVAHEARALPGAARVAAAPPRRLGRARRRGRSPAGGSHGEPARPRRRRAPRPRGRARPRSEDAHRPPPSASPTTTRDAAAAEQGADQPGRVPPALGEEPHRLGGLEGGEDERPAEAGAQDRRRARVHRRHAAGRSRGRRRSAARRAAGPASRAASRRARGPAISAAVPADSRVTTTSPSSSASPSTAIRSSALARPRTGRPRARPRTAPRRRRRGARGGLRRNTSGRWSLVLPRLLGVEPAAHAHVAGLAGASASSTASRHRHDAASRRGSGRPARRGPIDAQQPPAGAERDDAGEDEEQGDHRPMIAAGGARPPGRGSGSRRRRESVARRNLLDAWALR